MLTIAFMANDNKKHANERDAIILPSPMPENVDDGLGDQKKADSDAAFDDLEIEIEDGEVEAEADRNPSRRKH